MQKIYRRYIIINGIVQGVGFRPFVYRNAVRCNLKGWVKNCNRGVYIDVEGTIENLTEFIYLLKTEAPPLAVVEQCTITEKEVINYTTFTIKETEDENSTVTWISPDIALCTECEKELQNKENRRYHYPFINCTHCGPRFSIIEKLPYDRSTTTMKSFSLCSDCKEEYENPLNRRFHAQPNACPVCGPTVWLTDQNGIKFENVQALDTAREMLKQGKIIAVKGIGGFHLVCDASNEEAVETLRKRKRRPTKPFAVMMKNIDIIKQYCTVSDTEEKILVGNKKPILLLNKKQEKLPKDVAPLQKTLGVLLPYAPLHYLLFDEKIDVLVMTSANISGQPMVYQNEEAVEKLSGIVDYFLFHNREIYIPVEDSVSKVVLEQERVIRRARGYAPSPISLEGSHTILACGAQLKNTFCIGNADVAYLSAFIGDLDSKESLAHYERMIEHFKKLYALNPNLVVHDLHPNLLSTEFAKKQAGTIVGVQHHHAHAVSCMVENNIHKPVIGVVFDGTGYGDDGKIWGGEFLICDEKQFERVGHLNEVSMPGGEKAIKEPWRMGLSYLYEAYGEQVKALPLKSLGSKASIQLLSALQKKLPFPLTTSIGRLFDAAAALIGFDGSTTYEGEAAVYLESMADSNIVESYPYNLIEQQDQFVIDTCPMIRQIIDEVINNQKSSMIAQKFHNTVTAFTIDMCKKISQQYGIFDVVLSGGVFQNEILFLNVYQGLVKEGLTVYTHKQIPCNDGGVSVGQLRIAQKIMKERERCV